MGPRATDATAVRFRVFRLDAVASCALRSCCVLFLLSSAVFAQWDDSRLRPFVMDHRDAKVSPAYVSFLLDGPAGKDGFIRVENGHLAKGNGQRIRFWGVHFTDWSRGSVEIPPKDDMPLWASTLARFGVNLVRLHFLDLDSPRGLIDASGNDSRSFDPQQLDRLDFEVAQFKKRGIYVDLNLNVGRSYKAGDGVADYARIRWAKGLTLYDPRLIELEKEYARRLLTHVNPYTGKAWRDEPAVALVEIVNENGLYPGFRAPTAWYDDELTAQYNAWLEQHPDRLAKVRTAGSPVPRLKPQEIASAPKDRYEAEAAFYMDTERRFYEGMSAYLKNELGAKCPIIGTADHSHTGSPYPMLASLSQLDVVDGHVYWEHPEEPPPTDTPMVNDPLHSTVVQLSRTAFAGKPYTVSETNHPFPNEFASEGIPIIAAYGSFQDWDAIIMYTFEPKLAPDWKPYVGDPFDISLDPVRMTEMAAGALTFLRGDVRPALQTVARTYSKDQVGASRRLPRTEQPYFTPGFPLSLPLQHAVRIQSLDGRPTETYPAGPNPGDPIVSDTKELTWHTTPDKGLVTVDADRTQALIGFVPSNPRALRNLGAAISNRFAAIVLTALDAQAIARSERMLLTASSRVANTNMKWNETRTRAQGGESPSLIEPVSGTVTLRNLQAARGVTITALDGAGCPIGKPVPAKKTAAGWALPLGEPVTTWYVVSVRR